ncbi:ubiquitin conjugating enzyme family protein [Klebsormidium nitens]|uniref:RanBP-type and C3HC4-type zinc finger-containing protein 1 n=1 Tax=Klebsormidium nitens TaxID=105231 RepID=A0A1Y1HW22_KLENI|nr:ubiquitin conjugating enzyme family protein [Klebsormidium nitens]|eukprot:GAQ82844.1 ubiquitin conjugating enzyme family protein [Klebsormidium nitens]
MDNKLEAEEGQPGIPNTKTDNSIGVHSPAGPSSGRGRRKSGARKGGNKAPWSCSTCTLLNSAASEECAACAVPKVQTLQSVAVEGGGEWRSPYGENDSVAGPSVVPVGPDWACALCTFQNKYGAEECEMCAQGRAPEVPSSKQTQSGPQASGDVEQLGTEQDGEAWTCARCTCQNRHAVEWCSACAQPKATESGSATSNQPESLGLDKTTSKAPCLEPHANRAAEQTGAVPAKAEVLVDATSNHEPANGKATEAGAEPQNLAPTSEAREVPRLFLESAKERSGPSLFEDQAGPSFLLQCGICSSDQTSDTFCLDGCSHRFCTSCLKEAVQKQFTALPPAEAASIQQISEACVCPNSSCKTPLTQRDLILTAGEERARSHQQWLYRVLTRTFDQEGASPKCARCGEEQLSRVKVSQLGSLSLRDLRKALKARGLDASGKHPECAQRLVDVFAAGATRADDRWICIACPECSCVNCGAGLSVPGHDCRQALWGKVHDAVAELDKAYKAYLVSSISPHPQKLGKKQKTSHKGGSVWAAGTGYGGASDYSHHPHFWGGKHGKHKQPPQPPRESAAESKAKEAEREADGRLGNAMDALSACLSGGVGDGLVTGLSLPLVALVHESGVPARVLRALLLNDSMIDVSKRGALYLKALQLMRVLGAREELLPVICESPPKRPKEVPKPAPTPPPILEKTPPPIVEESPRRSGRRVKSTDRKGKRKLEEVDEDLSKDDVSEVAGTRAEEHEDDVEGTVLGAMEKLYKQASVVKVGLMAGVADEGGSDELDIGLVCEICDAFEELQRAKKGWEEARGALRSAQGFGGLAQGLGAGAQGLGNGLRQVLLNGAPEAETAEDDEDEDCVLLDRQTRKGKKVEAPAPSPEERARAHALEVVAYKDALKDLQFRMEPLVNSGGKPDHYFREKKNAIDNGGVHSQKRMLAISKEIGSLVTTLPLEWGSSVHLRVDEERMDLVKALIIGPGGTPYQNGAFLFDILLPPDYPQVSPKVQFMTTGGGRTRFNPNLYADGKVCLSILGTWAGPGWQPGKSTLMQVLLSIQGMIFVPEPYFNEPGYEAHGNKTASHSYTRNQRRNTLQLAVLGMLRHPPAVFADVIRTHFKLKRREIEAQCDEWAADDFAPKPAPKAKGKPAKKPKKKYHGVDDMMDWDSKDDADEEFLSGLVGAAMGGAMGGVHIDHETGRGSPIQATMKELLVELAKL